jgi:hypothetical protein
MNSELTLRVMELKTEDCLVVSDSKGTRNVQQGDELFVDDEIISGSIELEVIGQFTDGTVWVEEIELTENDEVLVALYSYGIKVPKVLLDGLFSGNIYSSNATSGDSE